MTTLLLSSFSKLPVAKFQGEEPGSLSSRDGTLLPPSVSNMQGGRAGTDTKKLLRKKSRGINMIVLAGFAHIDAWDHDAF